MWAGAVQLYRRGYPAGTAALHSADTATGVGRVYTHRQTQPAAVSSVSSVIRTGSYGTSRKSRETWGPCGLRAPSAKAQAATYRAHTAGARGTGAETTESRALDRQGTYILYAPPPADTYRHRSRLHSDRSVSTYAF